MHKIPHDEGELLVEKFEKSRVLILRMAEAEYLMHLHQYERGLGIMIDLLSNIGCDHAITDSIAMWLSEKGTLELKMRLLQQADARKKVGDISIGNSLAWAASMINT